MTAAADTLAFRARALAQSHPLTARAKQFVDAVVSAEQAAQREADIATWAAAEVVAGYCLRRVEEEDAGCRFDTDDTDAITMRQLVETTDAIATALRVGDPAGYFLGRDEDELFRAMNEIVDSEIDRRLGNFRDELSVDAEEEFASYVTAWVVTGYALRVAERELGALV